MNSIQVSVIIPAYNGDRYLKAAIDSILGQTYRDYEIIVVDDGSQDNTPTIVQSYGAAVTYIQQNNLGVAAARNRGLKEAKGKFIAFLDQDDWVFPGKLALQVSCLQQNPHLGFVIGGWQIVKETGVGISAVQPWLEMRYLDLTGLVVWKPVFLGAMLFCRSWLDRVDGFDDGLKQTNDVDLVLRLVALGCQAKWVSEIVVYYRQHQGNVSRDSLQQAQELELVLERFFAQPNLSQEIKNLEKESRYQSLIWSAWRLYANGYLSAMSDYLIRSFVYRQNSPTETIFDWWERFKRYHAEYGESIDVYSLTTTSQWQETVEKCLKNPTMMGMIE